MTMRHALSFAALGLSFLVMRPLAVAAQTQSSATGTWFARGVRLGSGLPGSVSLDLTQHADSVFGQLQFEAPGAGATPAIPVRGIVRADSLLLTDSQGVPLLAAQLSDRRIVGRIAGAPGRLNRGVPNLTTLADSRAIRFERQ